MFFRLRSMVSGAKTIQIEIRRRIRLATPYITACLNEIWKIWQTVCRFGDEIFLESKFLSVFYVLG